MLKIGVIDLLVFIVAIGATLLSCVITKKFKKTLKKTLCCIIAFLFIYFLYFLYLVYWPSPKETKCDESVRNIPVVFAPAFKNLGKDPLTNKYIPGGANIHIANKIKDCNFNLVLTQKAISDVFQNEKDLVQYSIEQMHKDNEIEVGTLEAVYCAIERVEDIISKYKIVGLIAHDKHLERSHQALEAVLKSKFPDIRIDIKDIHLGKTPYQDSRIYRSWEWGFRELFTRPIQSLLIFLKAHFFGFTCAEGVKYKKIPKKLYN